MKSPQATLNKVKCWAVGHRWTVDTVHIRNVTDSIHAPSVRMLRRCCERCGNLHVSVASEPYRWRRWSDLSDRWHIVKVGV